ncbi:MAG: ROK family protein [Bacteroidia bacterium]|nr:ROK family protein [Bacteroidia bacterium]
MFRNTAAIGADIGTHSLRIAVVTYTGEVIAANSYKLADVQTSEYLIENLVNAIRSIRKEVAESDINPICVGISAKGFIDHKAGIVIGPDRGIKGWKNVPLAKLINKATGLPAFVGNDANLMTIAEQRFGAARDYDNVIFVTLRTGIGGGIIINGKLYRGVNDNGGEVGQMIINFDDSLSDKGIKGSFEHYASATALVRRYCELSGKSVSNAAKSLTGKDVFKLSYKNDPAAKKAVKENAELVGIGLANLTAIFAPEIIVLGGGMSEARDSYINMIRKSAFANSLENCRSEIKIERAQLGSDAPLLGSAYYSMIRLAGKTI